MKTEERVEYRNYAWNYFELHAEHRIKAFNFFSVYSVLIIGAFSTLISRGGVQFGYFLLPASMIFFSFIFWKFEERTRMLVKNAESALIYLDKAFLKEAASNSPLNLFQNDDKNTRDLVKWPLSKGYFSYSRVFRWVYLFMGIVGILGVLLCFLHGEINISNCLRLCGVSQ